MVHCISWDWFTRLCAKKYHSGEIKLCNSCCSAAVKLPVLQSNKSWSLFIHCNWSTGLQFVITVNEKYSFVTFLLVPNLICVRLISAKNVIYYLVLLSQVLGSCAKKSEHWGRNKNVTLCADTYQLFFSRWLFGNFLSLSDHDVREQKHKMISVNLYFLKWNNKSMELPL